MRTSTLTLRAGGLALAAGLVIAGVRGVAWTGTRARATDPAHPSRPSASSTTAPDRTDWLNAALRTATDGASIRVPRGLYRGPFTLDRPVHLYAEPGAHLNGDHRTHTVAIQAAGVTLDGFEISGSGLDLSQDHAAVYVTGPGATIVNNTIHDSLHGIYVRQADGARIEGNTILGTATIEQAVDPLTVQNKPSEGELCEVSLDQNRRGNGVHIWNSSHHLVARNHIRNTRDGIYFSFVDRSDVRENVIDEVRYGLHYMNSDENRFEGNIFRNNAAGAALMSSHDIVLRENQFLANQGHRSYGVLLQTVENSRLERNRVSGNTIGVFFESGHGNRVSDNRIEGNYIGIHASDSSDGNVFAGNRFVGNLHTVETTGGNLTSLWSADGRGNYWDDAVTLDLDRDGISDLPHRELDLFGALRRDLPVIGLLGGSPAERLLRFVHARVALPGLSGVVDPAPLVRQPRR
jgi:nitrous oxidase accessory protein